MRKLSAWRKSCFVVVLCTANGIGAQAQTITMLHSFYGPDGALPYAGMIQGVDGNLYGTTLNGGAKNVGTIFKISPSHTFTTLYSFCSLSACSDGSHPVAALVLGRNGNFYGTTWMGGAHGSGTVFKITPAGVLTTLYSFCSLDACADGNSPEAPLIQATNGNFYGTTFGGGASGGDSNNGTVFEITPTGSLTTLHRFCLQSGCPDGQYTYAGLLQATDGNLYGSTYLGGTSNHGTVYKITPAGVLTTLHSFCSEAGCADGTQPQAGLVQGTNGNFYGTASQGGISGGTCGSGFFGGCGTVFDLSPTGTLTTLYQFCSQSECTDGVHPVSGLVQGTDGNFYGTTPNAGAHGAGTVFTITPSGSFTNLFSFSCIHTGGGCPDGGTPYAGLMQATNGTFYGTTSVGGARPLATRAGTVFSLSVGLGQFVEATPGSGQVGSGIKILGTKLMGTTGVSFNGTPAVFKVVSTSLIAATVPTGATTGFITVATPGGTLTSNVAFRVVQ